MGMSTSATSCTTCFAQRIMVSWSVKILSRYDIRCNISFGQDEFHQVPAKRTRWTLLVGTGQYK